ncbi:MAG TPA: 5-formyltetrahydrofolate cyclo-ligase, partial [Polyangiales bacterium]|nr:5-formyltetrahydrofolate cyclo-ligase [Polyangiales bacterium]
EHDPKAVAYLREHAKRELRSRMRSVRAVMPASAREERARAAVQRVIELAEYVGAQTIVGFSAIQKEIDPAALLAGARASGKRVGLPRVVEQVLELHEFRDVSELQEGSFGVLEPAADAPVIAPAEVDLVIVPGLAFDARGHRLGYGRAFYDRLLPGMSKAFRLGFAYDFQVVMELPNDVHDIPMHAVATDLRVMRV